MKDRRLPSHINARNHWFQKGEFDGFTGRRRDLPEDMTDWDLELYEIGFTCGSKQATPSSGHTAHTLANGAQKS